MAKIPGFIDRINNTSVPKVRSYVFLQRIGRGKFVDFIVDTGASKTALHPSDWGMFVPVTQWFGWTVTESLRGIAGSRQYAEEIAALIFFDADGNRFLSQQLNLLVGLLTLEDLTIPTSSLLGMDIMGKGSVAVDQQSVLLDLPTFPLPTTTS